MADDTGSNLKNLYCIEYPGNVKNIDRAIATLGGINNISNAFADSQRKLECRFRPDDRFCKALVSERCQSTAFVLKVIVKREKNDDDEKEKTSFKTTILGKVNQVFRFRNLDDFQYLPMERDKSGKLVSVYDDTVPKYIFSTSWLLEKSSLFLPPAIFSRTDTVQTYLSAKNSEDSSGLVGRTRDRRSNYVKFVSNDVKSVPDTPDINTLRYVKMKFVKEEEILRMKQLFDERPVWTKNALGCVTEYSEVQLKYLLSLNAYHFTSGPFRIAWVRFGYDPRKDRSSRKYQIVDYRMRSRVQRLVEERQPGFLGPGRKKCPRYTKESNYKFKPGIVPPVKQMFYQICDIEVPEVQQRLNSYPNNATYDSKSGWLTDAFFESVREILDKYVQNAVNNWSHDGEASGSNLLDESNAKSEEDSCEEIEFDISDLDDYNLDADDL